MEKSFSATLDNTSRIISVAVLVITLVVAYKCYNVVEQEIFPEWKAWLAVSLLVVLDVMIFVYRPLSYAITPYSVVVKRPVKDLVIDKKDVREVRAVLQEEMKFPIRTFGNGGLFGYTGQYYSSRMGNMRWYATRRSNYVLLALQNGRKIIITPDDPAGFLSSWNEKNGR
ncbi:MAG TPA: PH domain-containing protein [Bacteroidia bacterium]|nr:PH domain-containing protein [Bacteroidia bacterium]